MIRCLRETFTNNTQVGNQQFADLVDQEVELDRLTNREDIVTIMPGRFLGFRHPSGV